jgi:putative aminopeptidase FrvX
MLAAHMDAIGLMVTRVSEGLLQIDDVGGVDPRILPGSPVTVHGRRDLPGVVVAPPMATLPADKRSGPLGLANLLIDVGLPPATVDRLVHTGDLVSFATPPTELAGDTLSGHSLDNRASVAALTVCLDELKNKEHAWDVWAVATVQEEETYGGAATSAHEIDPDIAVAIDVTHAKGPGADDWRMMGLGKGPTLGIGANLHPFLHRRLESLAKQLEIPTSPDLMPADSGTDASAIQVAREGIPSALVSIPLRYMHTAVELVALRDIQRVGRLLAEFIAGLQPDFLSTIAWEDSDAD